MNLSLYATLFKISPFGKSSIIAGLRASADELRKSGDKKNMDEACSQLVAAGFFSMDINDFKAAAAIADALDEMHQWYVKNDASHAQKMRAHGNMLLLRTAVRIFQHNDMDLRTNYDALQSELSLVIVESSKYGKRWKLAQLQASQLQLYLDWLVLGEKDPQTWRTVHSLLASEFGEEKLKTTTGRWFQNAKPGWGAFVAHVQSVVATGKLPTHANAL